MCELCTSVENIFLFQHIKTNIFAAVRLQRIEIKGFKSFANETIIHFNEDVIGVVGPNGAGKSNIVDAVRWVLGEQKSKDLRLEKMSDVIFNGTKKRKASGLAYVSLTFENTKNLIPTEFQNVTIARYLYQSGESEYRLNNVPCRLKDIRSLFLDTGIGSNSYAIIALGMVEDILSDKENARRRMFEQASGISKYKARKKETINKLNSTQADLDRIEDLLYEIEQNLKELEKQAKRTQRYFDLKEKYKVLSIQLAILKIKDLRLSYQSLSSKIEREQDNYRQFDVKLSNAEAKLQALKQKHLDKEKSLSDFQRGMNDLIAGIRTGENDKKILEQRILFLEESIETLSQRSVSNEIKISKIQESLTVQQGRYEEEVKAEQEAAKQMESLNSEAESIRENYGAAKETLNRITSTFRHRQDSLVNLEKQLVETETNLSIANSELERLTNQVRSKNEEYRVTEGKCQDLSGKIDEIAAKVMELEEKEFKRMEELAKLEKMEDEAGKDLNALRRSFDATRHEHDLVKSLVDKFEGFPESIKFLNKSQEWKANAPLLSDLISCEDQYQVIIENYLESYLNYYVVDKYREATEAIKILSDAQKGRANFFVLEAFETDTYVRSAKPEGSINALEVVDFEPKFAPVVHYLLRNVYIIREIDSEQILVQDDSIVVLSQDGRLIRRKHIVTGGSVGLFEGKKLGRKKNLKKLGQTLKKLTTKIEQKEAILDDINDRLASLDEEDHGSLLDEERKNLEELKRQEVYLQSQLEHFQNMESDIQGEATLLKGRISDWQSKHLTLQKEIEEAVQVIESERAKVQSGDEEYAEMASKVTDHTERLNLKNIELIRHQGSRQAIERELEYSQSQIDELTKQLEEDRLQVKANAEAVETAREGLSKLEEQLLSDYEKRKVHEADLTEIEQAYYQARGEITAVEDEIRLIHKKQHDQQELVNNLKDEFNNVKFKMSNVSERLSIEFGVSLEDLLKSHSDEEKEDVDIEQLDEKVERMRNRIANYGEINPMAVDAYNEMYVRYESIVTQRDDILEARDSLLETIKEIENTATERFMEAFESVRENFIEVFRSLFTEDDNCDLILLDPQSPLTSPIEIIAKPKGKRPKTLSQLSGGEKTLTAIALLFGLYLLKPAPFCIFDEVDAPLDDANIEKFNRIIKQFSEDSQFIIVTHNKLTMASVDVIYGVYMEEQGISSVSPVDFRSFEHTSILETTN